VSGVCGGEGRGGDGMTDHDLFVGRGNRMDGEWIRGCYGRQLRWSECACGCGKPH